VGDRRRVIAVVLAVAVLAGLVVVGHQVWVARHRTDLSRALDVVPQETRRLAFTDWREVRAGLGVHAGKHPSSATVASLVSKAYDSDLSAVSSIDEAAVALQEHFGFSPATADWEAYAQSTRGAAMVLRMPDGFDFSSVTAHLADLGFTKPGSSTGVWRGGVDLVAAIDPTITPELQYVVVLADKHLLVTSDDDTYAARTAAVALGKQKSLGDLDSARRVVAPLGEPAAAMVWTRDFACQDLAMSQADPDARTQGEDLVARAGKITPLDGLVMAMGRDRRISVSELFDDNDAAQENLRARARLAVGEAPGRGGSFSDDLRLTSSSTHGATVQLRWSPRARSGFLLSALDSGPVLFATC
jgi:hypothetical protein